MKKSSLKLVALISIFVMLLGASFYSVEHGTFNNSRYARSLSIDFSYLEDYFQQEPEELLAPKAPSGTMIKVPIFIYHSVRPYVSGESVMQDRFDVTPELFEQQLVYLQSHGYTTISPDMLAIDIEMGTTTPVAKPVMLTFDDGWENQYKYAFPLLKKYHMIATFYVYTKPIDNAKSIYLSWDQLREMQEAGMTIGSHTMTHPLFKKISLINIQKEIFESKKDIEQHLHKTVLHFASPFGYSDAAIENLVKSAGYTTARGTHRGVYHSSADKYNLQGYFVSDSINEFAYILNR